jgi:hypothetical protein
VLGILADNNDEGHVNLLLQIIQASSWRDVWTEMAVTVHSFESLGVPRDALDSILWETCQRHDIVLITANRNKLGDASLETTIQQRNTSSSLPVFTLANPERILRDRNYAEIVAEQVLERLLDIDTYRGTGRIYLP